MRYQKNKEIVFKPEILSGNFSLIAIIKTAKYYKMYIIVRTMGTFMLFTEVPISISLFLNGLACLGRHDRSIMVVSQRFMGLIQDNISLTRVLYDAGFPPKNEHKKLKSIFE